MIDRGARSSNVPDECGASATDGFQKYDVSAYYLCTGVNLSTESRVQLQK